MMWEYKFQVSVATTFWTSPKLSHNISNKTMFDHNFNRKKRVENTCTISSGVFLADFEVFRNVQTLT